ncbi:Hypothetical protein, putative [Bodo saltans]|nr:Hypothetical protein, putative [Bodo saltans]|eukprot:CUI14571.1 Hypothetical protein, putative [Bodo saltans]
MLHQLLNVIKKADPYNVPAIKSFSDVEAEGFRFEANKFYKQPDLDLPLSNDTVAYRREIRQRILNLYKKYQPQKVDRVDPLMKEFAGKELELIEKMREKFGANSTELDKTNDDLFGYRRRLVAYCEKYLPESIDSVDRVLREYRGQEDRMFDILVKRFGPEPKDPVITPAAKESALRREQSKVFLGKMPAKERLLRIYKQYQPSKIGMIDEILQRYEGHEEVLFRKLEKLYGPEPEADAETISKKSTAALKKAPDQPAAASELDTWNGVLLGERVAAMCRRYTPGKVHTIPEVLEQFKGKEKLLLDGLVKKYGPEPIPTTPQSRDRLAAFFANHMAERMPDERLNEILLSFRGSEGELYESLAKRYGATGPFTAKGGVASIVKPNQKQHRKQSVVATDSSDDEPDAPADDNGDATFDVYETNSTGTGAPNNSSADGSRALTSPTGEVERMRSARRRRATSALTAGAIRSAKKEDKFEAVVLEKMDMLTELPFAEVPVPMQHLFPTFGGRAAIFMFERVLHWEPSTPPALRFMYMTSSHIYISSSETMVHRCFPIRELRGVYMTTKRTDQASQCSVLLKLQPYEHDCFFSVETDFEAKRFVWILLEVQHKYLQQAAQCRVVPVSSLLAPGIDAQCDFEAKRFVWILLEVQHKYLQQAAQCRVVPVSSLLAPGIDAQCRPKEGFGVQIEPVRKRHRALNDGDAHGSVALGELFSRLHEAVIEKNIDIEEDAEMEIQEAALMTRKSRGVLELSSKDKKVFGHGGSTRLQHQALRARLGSATSGDLDEVQLGVSDYQAAMLTGGDAGTRRPGDTRARFAHRGIDENPNERGENGIPFETREAQRRHLNPVQREQFFLHSHSGIYGTAVSGSLNGAARGDMFAVNGDVDGEIAQGPMAFAEADDPLAAHIPSNHNADGGYRGSSITSSSGIGAHQHLSHEEQLMQSGILGMSEVYEPSPLDRMGLFGKTSTTTPSRPPPKSAFSTGLVTPPPPQNVLSVQHFKGTSAVGSDKRKLMEAAQNSIHRALGQQTGGRVTHIHTMSPLSPQDGNSIAHYANVAVAPPPSQQMQFHHSMNTSGGGDFDDYIAGSARKR